MLSYGYLWQCSSSHKSGVLELKDLKTRLIEPKVILKISEKINCRSWSLSSSDTRSIFDRIIRAQNVLQQFSPVPCRLKNIYFFKRRRARAIFKKRSKNYLSFEIVARLDLQYWMKLGGLLNYFMKLLRHRYFLPTGFFIKKNSRKLQFTAINGGALPPFLRNQRILVTPQVLSGVCFIKSTTLYNSDWLLKKLNEAT